MLASSFAQHGVLPFVDDVVADRAVLDRYRRSLSPPVRLIVLAPSLDIVLKRDAARDKQVAAGWAYLANPMQAQLGGLGLWLDTSHHSVESTVSTIEQGWDQAVLA